MNTCDTCKWWNEGLCSNPKLTDDSVAGYKYMDRPNPDPDPSHACAGASDMYGQFFATGPKFGCIHHEPK